MDERSPPREADADAAATRGRGRWGLVALSIAALASSWNPVAAPFGLLVGLVTAVVAGFALRRTSERRWVAGAALAMSLVAVIASGAVVALTAGTLGVDLPGEPVVKGRTSAELDKVLGEAAERTRARRERALQELDTAGAAEAPSRPRR